MWYRSLSSSISNVSLNPVEIFKLSIPGKTPQHPPMNQIDDSPNPIAELEN